MGFSREVEYPDEDIQDGFEGDILENLNIQMRMYLMDIKEDIHEYLEEDPGNVTDIKEDILEIYSTSLI